MNLVVTSAEEATDPFVGTVLADRYDILAVAGRGGMGVVYKARQELIDRIVAIKMLKSDLTSDDQSVRRFQLEAKAASRLHHPNVITIHDFGVAGSGQPYIVMDFIEGESLADIIKREGRVNIHRAVPIFLQACSALEHAHRQHVIHRDVKPSNIVLIKTEDEEATVKVVDFGIAKLTALSGQESLHLTKTGEVFGSPIYMSPEQCRGETLTAASDIYSMGVTMYEALVGFPPLVGKTLVDTMSKHVNETPPSLRYAYPDLCVPAPIEAIILKALEKDKNLRYESMLEMKEALEFAYRQSFPEELPPDVAPQAVSQAQMSMPGASARAQSEPVLPRGQMAALRQAASRPATPPWVPALIGAVVLAVVAGLGWFAWSTMGGSAATGIVYFLQDGGDEGVLHLFRTDRHELMKLRFGHLDRKQLQGGLGAANGAVWNVAYHSDKSGLVLDNARFDAGFDEPVQAADRLVRGHYQELARQQYRRAYDELSPEWQRRQSYDAFEKGCARQRYAAAAGQAPTDAIKIVEQKKGQVTLLADLRYFVEGEDRCYRFVVKKIDDRWRIDRVEPVSREDWNAA